MDIDWLNFAASLSRTALLVVYTVIAFDTPTDRQHPVARRDSTDSVTVAATLAA